jgi:hypothetical protein
MGTQEILDQVLVWAVHSFVNKMNKEMKTSSYDQRDEVSKECLPNGPHFCPTNS